ncbi:MAG: putative tellurite resistance protein B-like protein, partial [Arenicella sp.]
MLNKLKTLFKKAKVDQQPSDQDLKLAAATLMFEVVRSDGVIDQVELEQMGKILQREFKLNQDEVDELFELAKDTADQAISLQGFTRDICDNWGNAKRMKLLEYLWM